MIHSHHAAFDFRSLLLHGNQIADAAVNGIYMHDEFYSVLGIGTLFQKKCYICRRLSSISPP